MQVGPILDGAYLGSSTLRILDEFYFIEADVFWVVASGAVIVDSILELRFFFFIFLLILII